MKKIVSVLLCLVMMMSLCTVAFAEHDCWKYATGFTYRDNGDGTHAAICPECKNPVDGADKTPHTYQYNKDGEWVGEGKAPYCICGAEETVACDHVGPNVQKAVDNKDGKTHKVICTLCSEIITEKAEHVYAKDTGKCACGAEKPVCGHVGVQKVVDNKDGKTHTVICPKCNEVLNTKAEHVYAKDTGKCACGAEKPVCDHVGVQKVVDNKDGKTHTVICPKCNEVLYTDVAHVYAEDTGKCACGAVKPAECKHEGAQKLVPNKDKKTHNAYCPECGELMSEKIPHTYQYNKKGEFVGKGGSYCLCGAKKSTSSAGGSTTTTTTNTTKSPKTGDMGVVLYAATALLSLSGTAVVIKKRKNDK